MPRRGGLRRRPRPPCRVPARRSRGSVRRRPRSKRGDRAPRSAKTAPSLHLLPWSSCLLSLEPSELTPSTEATRRYTPSTPTYPSAWKVNSVNFVMTAFWEVRWSWFFVRSLAVCSERTIATRPKEEVPMRRVIVSEFVSLDGVIEDPGGEGGSRSRRLVLPSRPRTRRGPVQVRRVGRRGRSPSGAGHLRGLRRRLAPDGGADRRVRPLDERLPQVRRLEDPRRALRVEQLHADQGRRRRRGVQAQAATRQRHPGLRQRAAGEDADGTQSRRRVPLDGHPRGCGKRQASLRGYERGEGHE